VCDHAVIFLHKTPDDIGGLHVGVVASKKVGNAVKRNRAKRLLRHAARDVIARLNDQDMWVVLIARASILDRNSNQVLDDLERGLETSGLLLIE